MAKKTLTCVQCDGFGCDECGQRGYFEVDQVKEECFACKGEGWVGEDQQRKQCNTCDGRGWNYN
jgi:DnaJ-class molecular chaperone